MSEISWREGIRHEPNCDVCAVAALSDVSHWCDFLTDRSVGFGYESCKVGHVQDDDRDVGQDPCGRFPFLYMARMERSLRTSYSSTHGLSCYPGGNSEGMATRQIAEEPTAMT